MKIVNQVRSNSTTRYYIQDEFFQEYRTCVQGILVLLQCEDPTVKHIYVNDIDVDLEKEVQDAKHFYKKLIDSGSIKYEGTLDKEEISITFDSKHPSLFQFVGEKLGFIEEWEILIQQIFPHEEKELLQIGVNFIYGKMNVNHELILEKGFTYQAFKDSFLEKQVLQETDGNITLNRPAHMLDHDWVISLRFQNDLLQVVQARLIVEGKTEAIYTGLNEDQRSKGFDHLCALLDKYVSSSSQLQQIDDMKLYVKEKTNVLAFKDNQKQCVGLTMFF